MPGVATPARPGGSPRHGWRLVGAMSVIVCATVLGGCGSSAGSFDAVTLLGQARSVVAATTSVHFVLSSDDGAGSGGHGLHVTGGRGDISRPGSLTGIFTVDDDGVTATVGVLAVRGRFLVKLPFQTTYATTDPGTYGISDPSRLLDRGTGLDRLLDGATAIAADGRSRIGTEVVDRVTARVPGRLVTIPPDPAPARPVVLTVGIIPGSHQVRSLALTGPFGAGDATRTYTLTLSSYDEVVHVVLPAG